MLKIINDNIQYHLDPEKGMRKIIDIAKENLYVNGLLNFDKD